MCETETSGGQVLGTGLSAGALGVVLAFSVLTFLFWDGPLWLARPGSSHAGRIFVSYGVAVPVILAALVMCGRLDIVQLASATGVVWAAKLLVTSSLYLVLASSAAELYAPARSWESSKKSGASQSALYVAAATPGGCGDLTGVVTDGGILEAGAVVTVEAPPPGRPLEAPAELAWSIRGGRHDHPVRLAREGDSIVALSADAALHTLRIARGGRAVRNVPLVAGAAPRPFAAPEAGVYVVSCENHPRETATLVVVDHPYAATTDGAGRFVIKGIPAGRMELCVHGASRPAARHTVSIVPGRTTDVRLDGGSGPAEHGGDR